MIDHIQTQAAADRIWNAIDSSKTCAPVRDILGENDVDAAYAAQDINTKRKLEAGEVIVGYKIGLTSRAVQQQLGVDQPDFGVLTNTMQVQSDQTVAYSKLFQPKIEAEIGFVASEDISDATLTIESLVSKLSGAVCCLEIVGSRIENWNIKITDTIADNASASHFVCSTQLVHIDKLDLEHCKMEMKQNGNVVSEGIGKACMDNPLNAALWLIKTMIRMGRPVKKGDIILAGALGPMVPVLPNDHFTAEIEGLGGVSVSFAL